MNRISYDPTTGRSYRRLNMCFACIHGFHLSCAGAECTCRPNHSSEKSSPMPHAAQQVSHQAQLAGAAAAH